MFWNEKIECMSREELEELQLKKLQDHLLTLLEENNSENKKETYMMEIMNQTLKDALLIAKIDSSSVINLKKFLTNLEVSINILFILFI